MKNVLSNSCGNRWSEIGGVLYFSVITNGMTTEEWVRYYESDNFGITSHANVVLSSCHKRRKSGMFRKIGVIKRYLFTSRNVKIEEVWKVAGVRKMEKMKVDDACLVRAMLPQRDIKRMGVGRIIMVHKPYLDTVSRCKSWLCTDHTGGIPRLSTHDEFEGESCDVPDSIGFAFIVPT